MKLTIAVDDSVVIELVKEQIENSEKEKKSWIICGFPKNKVQALALQKLQVIPDKIISMSCSESQCLDYLANQVRGINPALPHDEVENKTINMKAEHEYALNGVHDTFNHFVYHYHCPSNNWT